MAHCDPYAAYCFELLHSDDLGLLGKPLFEFLLEVLEKLKRKADLNLKCANLHSTRGIPTDTRCSVHQYVPDAARARA